MTVLNENNLKFLLDKGFKLKQYEDQGLTFYTKEIKDSHSLKKLIEYHYEIQEDEEINTKGSSFIMEIQTNGETLNGFLPVNMKAWYSSRPKSVC
ncbi:hypothetical protein [Bacillus vallismortis]|uniref:hypothetical protein n=1 Tax=Bacillus vallismortis TaxID=72361 RepID=UPI001F50FA0F|nr:hypothetical protein [Bacillus vallismortis]